MMRHRLATDPGTVIRLGQLLHPRSGRSLMVALDHGLSGVPQGLEHPLETIEQVCAAGPEAIVVSPGIARRIGSYLGQRGAPGMVVSLDTFIFGCFPGDERPHEEQRLLASVEEALRLGASAVKVLLVLGKEDAASYSSNLAYIGRVAERCHEWGMPLMVEPAPWGKQARHRQSAAATVAAGVRIAVELGADLVKTTYPGDAEVFRSIVAACPVPVCILGGPKVESQEQLMEMIRESVEAGGAGVVFGRNIWQADDPAAVIEAMKRVIHAPGPRR